jgi:hypothetical protein
MVAPTAGRNIDAQMRELRRKGGAEGCGEPHTIVAGRDRTRLGEHVSRSLRLTKFRELSLDDPFFDSLKAGYEEFPDWFVRKADEDLYVVDDDDELSGMLYLKQEEGPVDDVVPALPARKWLKIGTLKIVSRGTRLGERVIKKIFDTALSTNAEAIYVMT